MSRKIVITSGKGGVGKTTVTANLAYFLAMQGEYVVAVDADLGLNNLDVAIGIEGKITYDLFDCLEGRCRPKQALVQSPWHKNLFVLPTFFGKNKSGADQVSMCNVIDELARSFDYVLIDCPAGTGDGFRRSVLASDEALVVVTPHLSSIRDADKAINLISEIHPCQTSLVVNKMRGDLAVSGDILTHKEISDVLKIPLVGVSPDDDKITAGLTLGVGQSGKAFSVLAANVRKNKRKIYDCTAKYTGFFGSIRRKLKRIL